MTSNPELFRSANRELTTVLALVEDWSAPSTCQDWAVRDVLDHLIDTQRDFLAQHSLDIWATAGQRRGSVGSVDRP